MFFKRKLETSDKINLIGLILVSVFSLITFIRDCRQDKSIQSLNYQINALDYQPILKLIGSPVLRKVWFDSTLIQMLLKPELIDTKSVKSDSILNYFNKISFTFLI